MDLILTLYLKLILKHLTTLLRLLTFACYFTYKNARKAFLRYVTNFVTREENDPKTQSDSVTFRKTTPIDNIATRSRSDANICMNPNAYEMANYHRTHKSDPNLIETTFDDVVIIEDLRDNSSRYAHDGEFATKMASPPTGPFRFVPSPRIQRQKIPMHETSVLPERDTIATQKVAIVHGNDDPKSEVRKNQPPTLGFAPLTETSRPTQAPRTTITKDESKPEQLYSDM